MKNNNKIIEITAKKTLENKKKKKHTRFNIFRIIRVCNNLFKIKNLK